MQFNGVLLINFVKLSFPKYNLSRKEVKLRVMKDYEFFGKYFFRLKITLFCYEFKFKFMLRSKK